MRSNNKSKRKNQNQDNTENSANSQTKNLKLKAINKEKTVSSNEIFDANDPETKKLISTV